MTLRMVNKVLGLAVVTLGATAAAEAPPPREMGTCLACVWDMNICPFPALYDLVCQQSCGGIFYAVGCNEGIFCQSVVSCQS